MIEIFDTGVILHNMIKCNQCSCFKPFFRPSSALRRVRFVCMSFRMLLPLLILILTFASHPGLAFDLYFPTIDQCAPFTFTFIGSPSISDSPFSLSVLPFNSSSPLSIPIQNAAIDAQAVSISFLPFPAGTTFIASILDSKNVTQGSVTDVVQIQPSPTGNTSCLPAPSSSDWLYHLQGSLVECQTFNVSFDDTVIAQPPLIQAFTPSGYSISISLIDQPTDRTATYLMSAEQGDDLILLFDDLQGHRQTTPLLSVGGNSNSSHACTPYNLLPSQLVMSSSVKLSKYVSFFIYSQ
jgi:hypothetical protein